MEFGCSEGVTWIQPRADLLQPLCQMRTFVANDSFRACLFATSVREISVLSRIWDFAVP
jgi:hypothetical protein